MFAPNSYNLKRALQHVPRPRRQQDPPGQQGPDRAARPLAQPPPPFAPLRPPKRPTRSPSLPPAAAPLPPGRRPLPRATSPSVVPRAFPLKPLAPIPLNAPSSSCDSRRLTAQIPTPSPRSAPAPRPRFSPASRRVVNLMLSQHATLCAPLLRCYSTCCSRPYTLEALLECPRRSATTTRFQVCSCKHTSLMGCVAVVLATAANANLQILLLNAANDSTPIFCCAPAPGVV